MLARVSRIPVAIVGAVGRLLRRVVRLGVALAAITGLLIALDALLLGDAKPPRRGGPPAP